MADKNSSQPVRKKTYTAEETELIKQIELITDRTNNIDNISWVSNPPVNYSKEQEFTGTPGVTGGGRD